MKKLFTHTDLDGIGCAVLAKLAFGPEIDISFCTPYTINTEVDSFISNENGAERCHITDISISEDVAEKINQKSVGFQLLDHHPTAMHLNKYTWCMVKIEDEKTHIKTCGTELYYHWLAENRFLRRSDALDRFAEIVRDYDTWRWPELGEDGIICKQVNDLFWLYGREEFIQWCIDEIRAGDFPKFYAADKRALQIRQREIEDYIKEKNEELIIGTLCGRSCGFVFAGRFFSELGNRLCQLHPEIDFIAMIDTDGTISYRTVKDDLDLGKDIAATFGGGGHPKAAGSSFPQNVFRHMLTEIFQGHLSNV